jgi:uncharacterized membrane protein YidH (DUF202 family)
MKGFIHNIEIFGAVIIFIGMLLIGYLKWGIRWSEDSFIYNHKKVLIIISCLLVFVGLTILVAPEFFRN